MKPTVSQQRSIISTHSSKEYQWVLSTTTILIQDVTDAAELEDALRTQDADTIVSIKYKDHFFLWYLEILRKLCQIIEIIR